MLFFANSTTLQASPPFQSPEIPQEETVQFAESQARRILDAMIDRKEYAAQLHILADELKLSYREIQTLLRRVVIERGDHLSTKKNHLQALQALRQYRVKRRSWLLKKILWPFTFGKFGDKYDPKIEAEIKALEEEIKTWEPGLGVVP